MSVSKISARIVNSPLPAAAGMDVTVVVPTVKGVWGRKYGEHAYYFLNFRTSQGLRARMKRRLGSCGCG